jgi:hypothetical protein
MDQSAPSQPTRHPIFHAGPSEATTSLKKQPYTPQLPLEVWEQIGSGLSTLGMLKLSRIFGYRLPRDKDNHSRVWNAIFEDINWVDRATKKFGISPVIISQDLDRYYYQRGRRGPIYMVIALRDPTGDLKFDAQEFFDALRKPNHLVWDRIECSRCHLLTSNNFGGANTAYSRKKAIAYPVYTLERSRLQIDEG